MKVEQEILDEIEKQAELMLSIDQCALLFRIDVDEFLKDGEIKDSYDRGFLKSVSEVRKSIYKMAKQGSTPAQKQMVEFMAATNAENQKSARKKTKGGNGGS